MLSLVDSNAQSISGLQESLYNVIVHFHAVDPDRQNTVNVFCIVTGFTEKNNFSFSLRQPCTYCLGFCRLCISKRSSLQLEFPSQYIKRRKQSLTIFSMPRCFEK